MGLERESGQSIKDRHGTLRKHMLYNRGTIHALKHAVVMFHRPLINAQ